MKNLKSVKKVKTAFDSIYESINGVNVDNIYAILKYNPEILSKIESFKEMLIDSDNSSIYIDHPLPKVLKKKNITPIIEEEIIDAVDEAPEITAEEIKEIKPQSLGWIKFKPNVIWKLDEGQMSKRFKEGLMVSSEGDIWDLKNDCLLQPKFLDCEVKVLVKKDCFDPPELEDNWMRVAPIVCRAFGINSNTKATPSARVVIDYISGDRRDLRPTNLKWIKLSSTPNKSKILCEDICRRLIDTDGDVDKALKFYCEKTITKEYISNIRNKMVEIAMSDRFFTIEKGVFTPTKKYAKKNLKNTSFSITREPDDILASSIRKGTLTIGEKNFLIIKTIDELQAESRKKKLTAEDIVDTIRDKWKVSLPTDMANTILSSMGGIK